jgi:glucoamylase
MPRDLPIGNGTVSANFDSDYNLRDLYYPHVGMENQTAGDPIRFGVWADGVMKWIWDGWKVEMKYLPDTLVTDVHCVHPKLQLELFCHDCVDFHIWVLLREVVVKDLSGRNRDVRLFYSHDFHIKENDVGDTAYYDPKTSAVIHYKQNRYFLINLCTSEKCGVDHFATGIHNRQGYEGTWRDAEDGELSGNPIAQGSVDSCIGINLKVPANGTNKCSYWVACQQDYDGAARINKVVREKTPEALIKRTINYWKLWVNKEEWNLEQLPTEISELFKRSLLVLRTLVDNGGAIIAATDYDVVNFANDTYSYMWPRDGAMCAYSLIKAGYSDISRQFFQFCLEVISSQGYMLHKFNPDKTLASSWEPWLLNGKENLPIQEDETALVIWSLWHHFHKFREIEFIKPLYRRLIINAADFMVKFRDKKTHLPNPSYDLWEEQFGVHLFTAGAVVGGLRAAANFACAFGETSDERRYEQAADEICEAIDKYMWSEKERSFCKTAYPNADGTYRVDMTADASCYGIWAFGAMEPDNPKVAATMKRIREKLRVDTEIGGIARYGGDNYQRVTAASEKIPGNPWIICTLWLAQYDIALAKTPDELARALDTLKWAVERALPSGVLAEQVHPFTGKPISVSPLAWSHATVVMTVIEYLERLNQFSGKSGQGLHTSGRNHSECLKASHIWEG